MNPYCWMRLKRLYCETRWCKTFSQNRCETGNSSSGGAIYFNWYGYGIRNTIVAGNFAAIGPDMYCCPEGSALMVSPFRIRADACSRSSSSVTPLSSHTHGN